MQWLKEGTLSISSGKKSTFFYVRGVDCSSPGAIGTYVNYLINEQEKGGWVSSWKISKITFCIFDSINRLDLHMEFQLPGSTKISVFDQNQNNFSYEEIDWDSLYISSVLRYIKLIQAFPLMPKKNQYNKQSETV